ncbi:hypothetical protein [Paracoccus marcusii]|uniref:hypothetical protein n=1 Tax=Paracoccus marcusii TaxID=59779 RepID=UPI00111284C7|nr:hypothetical protein [Paracoccus marcusii]TNB85465.1 hypothetical protein FHD68_18610 [Paracoccus marcusii]
MPNLARAQYWTIIALSSIAFLLSLAWIGIESSDYFVDPYNLEPFVVAFASFVPIVTLFWPFKPKHRSTRIKDTLTVNGSITRTAEMGEGESLFIITLSPNSSTSAHIRFSDPSIRGSYVTPESRFSDIKNAAAYHATDIDKTANRGDIVAMKNRFNNYCLFSITKIIEHNNNRNADEWVLNYVIDPKGGVNFS